MITSCFSLLLSSCRLNRQRKEKKDSFELKTRYAAAEKGSFHLAMREETRRQEAHLCHSKEPWAPWMWKAGVNEPGPQPSTHRQGEGTERRAWKEKRRESFQTFIGAFIHSQKGVEASVKRGRSSRLR